MPNVFETQAALPEKIRTNYEKKSEYQSFYPNIHKSLDDFTIIPDKLDEAYQLQVTLYYKGKSGKPK